MHGTILLREPGRYVIVLGAGGAQTIPWQDVRRIVVLPSSWPVGSASASAPSAWGPPAPTSDVPQRLSELPADSSGSAADGSMGNAAARALPWLSPSWAGVSVGWDLRFEMNVLLKHYAIDGGGSLWSGGLGAGGGLSASLHFRTPASIGDDARATWLDFEVGLGESLHVEDYADGLGHSMTLLESETPVIVGVHAATGTLWATTSGGAWSGLALGLAWVPTFVEVFGDGQFNSGSRLNPAGVRFTADVGPVRRAQVGHVPMIRVVATWLPYVGALPTTFSAGVGCVFF